MKPLDTFRFSIRALRDNKMRSALTMLGVVIGVSAVVTAVAVGQGASTGVTNSIGQLGNNLLTIIPGSPKVQPGTPGLGSNIQTLKPADADAIIERCSNTVLHVAPQVRSSVVVKYGSKTWRTTLNGTTPAFMLVNNYSLDRGRPLNQTDDTIRSRVVCIGRTVVQNLFGSPDINCIGQEITLNRVRFQIVGILAKKGANTFGQDQDDVALMPLATAMNRVLNQRNVTVISVQCRSADKIDLAMEQIVALLRHRHKLAPPFPDNDDFNVLNQAQLLNIVKTIGGILTLLLAGIAAISLTVGGVGIMNIMLVSVTERTREIGIRKALGATEMNIRTQFLIESALLSAAGGLVGVVLGASVSYLAGKFSGWPIAPSPLSAVIAVGVSAGIGIFFGYWPAGKAARLHPIEALRHE
jgi:putative ABC transport system permease protein